MNIQVSTRMCRLSGVPVIQYTTQLSYKHLVTWKALKPKILPHTITNHLNLHVPGFPHILCYKRSSAARVLHKDIFILKNSL